MRLQPSPSPTSSGSTTIRFARRCEASKACSAGFSIVGEEAGVTVVDDYGHHPAEVEVTLEAAQKAYGGRIVVAFQPHRYTRTRDLFDELTRAFNRADVLFLTEVYAAGEKPIEGADARRLAEAIRAHGHRDVDVGGRPEGFGRSDWSTSSPRRCRDHARGRGTSRARVRSSSRCSADEPPAGPIGSPEEAGAQEASSKEVGRQEEGPEAACTQERCSQAVCSEKVDPEGRPEKDTSQEGCEEGGPYGSRPESAKARPEKAAPHRAQEELA